LARNLSREVGLPTALAARVKQFAVSAQRRRPSIYALGQRWI
jgi:hypothetical protein